MNKGWMSARALGAALAAGLALSAAPAARAACELKTFEIPVRMVGARPVATLTLNGVEVPMLVDSGAFYSMLAPSTAEQLQLPKLNLPDGLRLVGYTGRIEAYRTRVDKVGLLGGTLSKLEFIVGGNEIGGGIMGVLGRNILSAGDTEYDLAHGVVRLMFPKGDCAKVDMAYWAPKEAPVVVVPLETDGLNENHQVRVRARVNGTGLFALMDTGAPKTSLTLGAALRVGLKKDDLTELGRTGGAGQGQVRAWTGRFASFELGGERVGNNVFQVDDTTAFDDDMLLGLDYFLSHRILVSRTQRQVYITWNGGAVFAQGTDRAGTYDTRLAVVPKGPADDDADGLARRGAAALAAGDTTRALADLDRAIALAPTVAGHFLVRARIHLEKDDAGRALADLDQALALDPALADARIARAAARLRAGNGEQASADLARLDADLPPSSHLRARMARVYLGLAREPEALRQWTLWIDTHPKDAGLASALNERCWLRTRRGEDLARALEDCRAAVDKDGDSAEYRDSLGWTYLRLNDAARARRAFDQALERKALAWSLYGRGLALRRLDDARQAERDLEAARRLTPDIDEAVRAMGFEALLVKAP